MRNVLRMLAASLTLACGSVLAADLPGPVVTAQWLNQHRDEVTILDVRDDLKSFTGVPQFTKDSKTGAVSLTENAGHIPGALLVDYTKVRVERVIDGRKVKAMLPDRAYFESLMRSVGVKKGKPIVITVTGETPEDLDTAARMYWSIRSFGNDSLAILDGGTSGWLEAGLAFSSSAAAVGAGDWQAGPEHPEIVASSDDVAKAAAAGTQLVDARPLPFFVGLAKKPVTSAAGHIAGAVDFPGDVRGIKTGSSEHFLTGAQYRGLLKQIGVREDVPTITYCNTGHLASGAWFVLSEVLGNKNVRVYDGSLHEWTLENRPLVGLN